MKHTNWIWILAAVLALASGGCGDDDAGAAGGTDADTDSDIDSDTDSDADTDSETDTDTEEQECEPGDVSGYTPDWKPPSGFEQGLCTVDQIAAYIDACLDTAATTSACDEWTGDEANAACFACALTPYEDAIQGPLGLHDDWGSVQVIDGNVGQCISALEGDDSADSCGAAYEAAKQCGIDACKENCSLDSTETFGADLAMFNTCIYQAIAGDCAPYQTAWATCSADLAVSIDDCIWSSESFATFAERLVTLHCGPPA
ncbi:MAG: hypothetical protein M0R80_06395 [Proteobacteria bacterium]|nr:hypothetical protein [Pseudomonadota bacterium]